MILNLPPFVVDFAFEQKDANAMYERAQKDGVKFNNFIEWIQHDLNKSLYSMDSKFLELEKEYLKLND
jgi:hypothetical protein